MSLPQQIVHFGVHSATFINRVDGTPYGTLKAVQGASLSMTGKLVSLMGGSSKYPFDVQEGEITTEMALKFSEYPSFVFTLFAGVTPTDNAADSLGAISTLTNKYGTSCQSATIGIASVGIKSGSEADVKFLRYVVLVKTATTVNVYGTSDVDFGRGTAEAFQDGTLKLLAANVSITSGAGTDLTGWGITLTGGSGTIGMTVGDTATFETRPKNTGSTIAVFGQQGAVFPEFGTVLYAKKLGSGFMVEIEAYRCKGEGLPLHFDPNKYSEADVKVTMMYDSAQDAVFRMRRVSPITPN